MKKDEIIALFDYIAFLENKIEIYERDMRSILEKLKEMKGYAPDFFVLLLEKNTDDLFELQHRYMKSVVDKQDRREDI